MKKPIILFFLIIFSSKIFSQIIGGTRDNEITPKTLQAGKLSKGSYNGNVNLFSGEYNASYPIGTVSTPCGLSYTLSYNYSSSFVVGGTPQSSSGIPYGEGWSLNIPTITVNTDVYKTFESDEYCNSNNTNNHLHYDNNKPLKEGDLYWYGPEINIPGVASGRAVFKYIDGGNAVFVLNEFESPITIKFNGSDWYVQLEDGTMYIFEVAMHDVRSPTNARTLDYKFNSDGSAVIDGDNAVLSNYINVEGGDVGLPSSVLNAILPHEGFSSWYCGKIINPNYPLQSILFVYETFGAKNYFKEFQQSGYGEAVNKTSDFYTLEYNPDFTIYSDILLKSVSSFGPNTPIDKVVLNYETRTSLLGGDPFIDFRNNPDASRTDSLYSSQKVVINNSLNPFQNWVRFKHASFMGNSVVNMINPYINGSYYNINALNSAIGEISFDHGFLEAKKIPITDLYPGDTYEIKTKISKPGRTLSNFPQNGTGTLDIAVMTGSQPTRYNQSGTTVSVSDYDATHQNEIFSTFNRALKWQMAHDENAMTTSNLFVMPNIPSSYGNVYVQIGPGNSDTDFGSPKNSTEFDVDQNGGHMYHAFRSYTCFNNNRLLGPIDQIQHNFGIGLPWSNVLPLSKMMTTGIAELQEGISDDLEYFNFWWQYDPSNNLPNIPTKFDNTVKLEEFELIRHAKNPYMLKSVSTYHLNGEIGDNGQGNGWKLTSKKIFNFKIRTTSLLDKIEIPNVLEQFTLANGGKSIVYFELESIEDLPVNTDLSTYDVTKILRTSFEYESFIKVDFNLNPNPLYNIEMPNDGASGNILTKITDHLGGITHIKYYSFESPITHKSRLYQRANECEQTFYQTADIDRPTMIYPVVEYIIENDEQNLNLDDATINTNSRKTYYEYNFNDKTSYSKDLNFSLNNFYNSTTSSQKINPGFKKVNVYSNSLATGEQNKTEYIHFTITDTDINETARYLYAGKLRSVKEFDNTGKIHHEKIYKYGNVKAFENGYNRPLPVSKYMSNEERYYDRLVHDYEYKDYYRQQEEVVIQSHYEGTPPNQIHVIDATYTGEAAKKNLFPSPLYLNHRPDFLEYEFFREIEPVVPEYKLNSYFVRLEEETERTYENYLYKTSTIGKNPNGGGIPIGDNPFGIGKNGAGISGLNEAIISFINDSKNTPVKIKERLIQETPLSDQVLAEVVITNRLTSNFKTDILLLQQGLTNQTWKNLLTNEKLFSPKQLLDLITIQEYFADEIQLKAIEINHKNFDSKVFEGIFLKQGVISDLVRNSLLDATYVDKKSIAEIFRRQSNMTEQILVKLINSSNILSSLLPSILINQNLSAVVYEALILRQDLYSSDLATIIEQAKEYPSDEIISNVLQRSPRIEFNDFKRIVEKTEIGFGDDLALLTKKLLDEWFANQERGIDIRVNENQALLYCSNPTIQDWNYIETKTSYEYYEADYRGSTDGRAYKTLMALGNFPKTIDLSQTTDFSSGVRIIDKVYLKHEPSWQIFSKKTSSTNLPEAFNEEQFFYTFDLKNRYDRYWFNYDCVGPNAKSFVREWQTGSYSDTLGFINYWYYDGIQNQYVDAHTISGLDFDAPVFPKYDAIIHSIDKNLRTLPFQKIQYSKNVNDDIAKQRAEYYHYDSRWNFEDDYDNFYREFEGPECPIIDDIEEVCGPCQILHGGGWQNLYRDATPFGYCFWMIDIANFAYCPNGFNFRQCVPNAINDFCNPLNYEENPEDFVDITEDDGGINTDTDDPVSPSDGSSTSSGGTSNMPPPSSLLKNTLQLAKVFVQLDDIPLSSDSDFEEFKMDHTNNSIMELYIGSFNSTDAENFPFDYKPILPFANIMISEVNTLTELMLPKITTNQIGIKTRYYYSTPTNIWNKNINCSTFGSYSSTISTDIGLPLRITVGYERSDSMATAYEYNEWGIVSKVTQPSGHYLEYAVDEYLRLKEVKENGSRLLSKTSYHTWDKDISDDFSLRTEDNFVSSITYNNYFINGQIIDTNNKVLQRSYMDPLGREIGTTTAYIKNNFYQHIYSGSLVYDRWDRVVTNHKPTIAVNTIPMLELNGSLINHRFHQQYEATPKKRKIRVSDYEVDITDPHTIKTDYSITNYIFMNCELNLSREELKLLSSNNTPTQGQFKFYRTLTEDQDMKQTVEYSNAFGQKIATLAYDNANQRIVTLFAYDSYGNLTKVINPEKQESNYRYNIHGLLISEKTVDAGEKKYIYNKHFKVSMAQDQLHRDNIFEGVQQPLHRSFIYDDYGRLLFQGVNSSSLTTFQFENQSYQLPRPTNGFLTYSFVFSNAATFDWMIPVPNLQPSSENGQNYQVVLSYGIIPESNSLMPIEKAYVYGIDGILPTVGKLLKTSSYRNSNDGLNNSHIIQQVEYSYDAQDRVSSQLILFNPNELDGTDATIKARINYPSYNYQGSLLEEVIDIGADNDPDFQYSYAYDELNRLNRVYAAKWDVNSKTLISEYFYENVFNKIADERQYTDQTGIMIHQGEYKYDFRERLDRYTGNLLEYNLYYDLAAPGSWNGQNVQFSQNFNGNINGLNMTYHLDHTLHNVPDFTEKTIYGYHYDKLNRLYSADALVGDYVQQSSEGYLIGDEGYNYNRIGNLLSLSRYKKSDLIGSFALLEDFSYDYFLGTNKLRSIGSANNNPRSYNYDSNGNLLSDSYKQITQTVYGRASYPYQITKGTENYNYLYDVNDQRIYKDAIAPSGPVNEYYLKDALGRDVAIFDMLLRTWVYQVYGTKLEARVDRNLLGPNDCIDCGNSPYINHGDATYFLYDYLGNTRVTYRAIDDPNTHSLTKQIEYAADYMPYGKLLREFALGDKEKYLTTHHERDQETQLDYRGARYYDSDVARFLGLDPKARDFVSWNAYNYVLCNPIMLIDADGKAPTDWFLNNKTGKLIYIQGQSTVSQSALNSLGSSYKPSDYQRVGGDKMFGDFVRGDNGQNLLDQKVAYVADPQDMMESIGLVKAENVLVKEREFVSKGTADIGERASSTHYTTEQIGESKIQYVTPDKLNQKSDMNKSVYDSPYSTITTVDYGLTKKYGQKNEVNSYFRGNQKADNYGKTFDLIKNIKGLF